MDSNDYIRAEGQRGQGVKEPRGRGRVQEHGRDPPPQRHERPQEEERPRQQMATCNMPGSAVSSGVNNIGNNMLLNLEVDPGGREINSLLGVAVCYDTGQMTTYPLIMSKTFFTNVMGNVRALTPPPHMQRNSHWGRENGIGAFGVFSSQSKHPPIVRLAEGGLDLLCVPKSDK